MLPQYSESLQSATATAAVSVAILSVREDVVQRYSNVVPGSTPFQSLPVSAVEQRGFGPQKLDDGWPESEKGNVTAAVNMMITRKQTKYINVI